MNIRLKQREFKYLKTLPSTESTEAQHPANKDDPSDVVVPGGE